MLSPSLKKEVGGKDVPHRFRSVAHFISLDLILQAIGFAVGLTIIRGLPKETYGQYAVYVGILFASILISESGLSNVMLGHANNHGRDPSWTSDLRRSGLFVRRRIGLVSSVVGAATLGFLLVINDLDVFPAALALLAYIASMQAVFIRSNSQVFLRLNGLASSSQRNLVLAALLRLVTTICVMVFVSPGMHFVAIVFVTAGTFWAESWLMSRSTQRLAMGPGSKNPLQIRRLRSAARRLAPMNLATVGREQAFLVIMSLLGSTIVLGEIAAFTRFAIAFTLLNSFMLNILLPRIARLKPEAALKTIPIYAGIYSAVALLAVWAISIFSPVLLWILGESYSGLEIELVIVMAGSSLLSFCGALAMMGQSRGWLGGAWVAVVGSAVWAVGGPFIFDLSTTIGGALYVGTQGVAVLLAELVRFMGGIRSVRKVTQRISEV